MNPSRVGEHPVDSQATGMSGKNSAALDQWRGCALLLVLISHALYFTERVQGLGRIGVNLFFFISGILVFRSLAGSARSGLPLAASFWKRRFLRLYPAMVAYLAVISLVVYFGFRTDLPSGSDFPTFWRSLPFALLFLVNYSGSIPPSDTHLWSVSVEMQFYLLAPAIYLFGKVKSSWRVVFWLAVLALLMTLGLLEIKRGYQEKYAFQVAAWPMMLGFVAESQKSWLKQIPAALVTISIYLGLVFLLVAIGCAALGIAKALVVALGTTVFIPCYFSYLAAASIPGRWGGGLKWCGERTYSIYLWQQPLTICNYLPNALHLPGAVLAVGISALWYRWLEQPFLSTRRRDVVRAEEVSDLPASV